MRVGRPLALRLIVRDNYGNELCQPPPAKAAAPAATEGGAITGASGCGTSVDTFKVVLVSQGGKQLPGRCRRMHDGSYEVSRAW